MTNKIRLLTAGIALLLAGAVIGVPSVYPTGTTIYDPERAWNGYTIFIAPEEIGAVLVDMNGNTVRHWTGFHGAAGGPARLFPDGSVLSAGPIRPGHQESHDLIHQDWDGNVIWRYEQLEQIEEPDGSMRWSARQHHDWQREGLHAGYYSPGAEPVIDGGRTMFLAHATRDMPDIAPVPLIDDRVVEIAADGEILFDWYASDHIDELGLSARARERLRAQRTAGPNGFDWLHINAATWLGPNRWYDAGDERFHPDNIMISLRFINTVAIVARDGSIAWTLGPDYSDSAATAQIGQVIGQHQPHLIPAGLPGAGNLLLFDNGASGWGVGNVTGFAGTGNIERGSSRVLEIDPMTLEVVWSYSMPGRESFRFHSFYISSAQRLPNGNTMITEGADGRLFEVDSGGDIVWEYVSPYFAEREAPSNAVYRAYRVPYDWAPQLDAPEERAVVPPALSDFRIAPR